MIHITICDDETHQQELLKNYLERFSEEHNQSVTVTSLFSGEELLEKFDPETELLFLDIQMGKINGIEAARALREKYPRLCILLITSQVQYVMEGYGIHAFSFIAKPVQYGQFAQQVSDALATIRSEQTEVTIKTRNETMVLNINDILYAEVMGHSAYVVTARRRIDYPGTMNELEEQLPSDFFFRPHRSFLINLKKVQRFTGTDIIMANGEMIPLSKHRRAEFRQAFTRFAGDYL